MANPNENCLEGMQCPNPDCGSYGPFVITVVTDALHHDDGIEDYPGDTEWDNDSVCKCKVCEFISTVQAFREPDPYPENTKKNRVAPDSQKIGDFLETMSQNGFTLCEYQEPAEGSIWSEGKYYPTNKPLIQLLADYFEIDLKKVDAEQRQILEDLRKRDAEV